VITLVVGDPLYFRNFTWDKADEFVNDHPDGRVSKSRTQVVMTCGIHNLRNRCKVQEAYYRIASPNALRGIAGPVETTFQSSFKPRCLQEIYDNIKIINGGKEIATWMIRPPRPT